MKENLNMLTNSPVIDLDEIWDVYLKLLEAKRDTKKVPDKHVCTHKDYANFVTKTFDLLRDKIVAKSNDYTGGVDNVLVNPIDMAIRSRYPKNSNTVFMMLNNMKSKHEVTLMRQGMNAMDVVDRLTDIILYTLLELYVVENKEAIDKVMGVWYNDNKVEEE